MKKTFLILSLTCFCSCGQSLDQKAAKIQKGMSEAEVIQILGKPEAVDLVTQDHPHQFDKWFYGITSLKEPGRLPDGYMFLHGDAAICVGLMMGKVVDVGPDMDDADKFVKTEDFPRVKDKVDPFYARDLEKPVR